MSVDLARLRTAKASGEPVACGTSADGSRFALRPAYPTDPELRGGDVRAFAHLRERHADSFFDTARPSENGVRRWVEERYDADETQINFVATDDTDHVLLFLGLSEIDVEAGRCEFGRLMRAEDAPKGIAAHALPLLFGWAKEIGFRSIYLEVFADNEPARRLYERCGFRFDHVFRRTPIAEGERILWQRGSGDGDRPVLAMILDLTDPTWKAEA